MSNAAHKAPRVATRTQSRQKTKTQRRIALMLLAGLFASGGWPARCSPIVKPRMRENGSTRRPPSPRNSSLPTVCRRHTAATTYPDHLVNGDFEYLSSRMLSHETSPLRDPNDFTFIDPANGQRLAYPGNTDLWKWTNIPGFNKSKFAWTSSQTLNANYPPQRAGAVELQLDRDGNTYAELAASQSGTAIYQKIATTPGVAYTVRLSHASQSAATGMDKLQVLIGPQGRERPVEMTRTTSNKAGDRIGETSTVVATRATNTVDSVGGGARSHAGQWDSYRGTYIATSDITVFTFKNLRSQNQNVGNLLDNIIFTKAYKLNYSGSGNTGGITPKQSK